MFQLLILTVEKNGMGSINLSKSSFLVFLSLLQILEGQAQAKDRGAKLKNCQLELIVGAY
jgi:hypothetical protein